MKQTINISHFISKETLSNIKLAHESVNRMIRSDSFKSIIETASQIDKILTVNIASFCSSEGFRNLQSNIEIIGRNRNRILSAFTQANHKLIGRQDQKIQIEDQNSSSLSIQGRNFKEDDFVRLDYQLTITKEENKSLKYKLTTLQKENKILLEYKNKYITEKRNGGGNSHQQNHDIKELVKKLCKKEMESKKYPSANQLCKEISKQIETDHKDLLLNFIPYQKHSEDGGGWTNGTFYNWCNANYKKFK